MKKREFLATVLLAALVFSGCGALPAASGSGAGGLQGSSVAVAGPAQYPPDWYTLDTVENLPAMEEIDLRAALHSSVFKAAGWLAKVAERGLRYPTPLEFWERDWLFSYCWYRDLKASGGAPPVAMDADGDYVVPPAMLTGWVGEYLAGPAVDTLQTWVTPYSEFAVYNERIDDLGLGMGPEEFKVTWQDVGARRNVTLYAFRNWNYAEGDQLHLVFERGDDGVWRFWEANEELAPRMRVSVAGATELAGVDTDTVNAPFGAIGNTVYTLDEWDHKLTISARDGATLVQTGSVEIDDAVLERFYLKNEKLYLLLADRVVVLGADLRVQAETPLPAALREVKERPEGQQNADGRALFWDGYDVNEAFDIWAYATEEGLFLYTAGGETKQLQKAELVEAFGFYDVHGNPRFSNDDKVVYAQEAVWEGPCDIYAYSVATGKGTRVKQGNGDVAPFVTINSANANMRNYFGGVETDTDMYYGYGYYVHLMETYWVTFEDNGENGYSSMVVGSLSDPDPAHAKTVVAGSEEVRSALIAVLADGRVIFGVNMNHRFYEPQIFISPPFAAL